MESREITFINIIKLPFIFILYLLYIIVSIFIPTKLLNKIIDVESLEEYINLYFNNSFYLKIIALLITIILYIYIYIFVS